MSKREVSKQEMRNVDNKEHTATDKWWLIEEERSEGKKSIDKSINNSAAGFPDAHFLRSVGIFGQCV